MGKIMKFVVTVEDESGETLVTKESARTVPFVEEIEKQGFYDAFDDLETAVLEMTKETWDAAVSEYLAQASKKTEGYADEEREVIYVTYRIM